MTAAQRAKRAANEARQSPVLPSESRASAPPARMVTGGAGWLIRPMPDGQWPVDPALPRDDSFSWWVKSSCGHPGGLKQWAFYHRRDAELYERVFRDDPCRYTRCPTMIKNEKENQG